MRTRSSRRLPLVCAAIAVAAVACVSPNRPGVAIDSVEADVVFGIDKAPTPVLPANTDVGEIPEQALSNGFAFRFRNPAADRLDQIEGQPPAAVACPTAPPTAAADRPAEATITGEVRVGVYTWKRTGTQTKPNPAGGEPLKVAISGFERRILRNVQPYDDEFDPDAYTFEMVQTLLDRPVVQIRTFLVKPQTSAQVAPGGLVVVDEPRANDPEGGVSLIKVEEFDENDQSLGTFEPSTGLLYIGLPVDPSESFSSVATDPKSGQTIVQDAHSVGRTRIDACGDLVDGWRVESTQSRSDAASNATYNYLIATQYGGVPILEEISTTAADGSELNVTFSLGQLNPDPLPAES